MKNSAEQIIIHNAKELGNPRLRWQTQSVAVFTYTQNSKIWVAAFAGNLRHRYAWQPKPALLIKQERKTLTAAESFVNNCIEDPQKNFPLSEISNEHQRTAISRQLEHLEIISDVDGALINSRDWPDLAEKAVRAELKITLSLGQSLVEAVRDTSPLTEDISRTLKHYLECAPLGIGHWGSFKRLFKLLEERPDARALYGIALSRIDCGIDVTSSDEEKIENLGFLLPLFAAPVASPATLGYLGRRGRRVLRRISKTEPEQYADCAEAFLAASDNLGNRVNLERVAFNWFHSRQP